MKAKIGDVIKTNVNIGEGYPEGSKLRVHGVIDEINEVMAYPMWYEKGMKCFGFCVFLEDDDYELCNINF
ncbi:hypothetical protein MOB65_20080 [Bacillus inaquosorum]|uniref:hypothetical protein n=1 Tax=Bacillus inaquosorum TaxID=483913 RepID=UPI00227E936D|nr:hypothetical protein [Bacillus inaquosorum]MCY7911156.1 hypothetical protein [Bacillus inaquosorum]MED3440272.1 hypothetical protein [Bacillus subtilis]MED3474643.1 hypothetical protein [Bacillus subtilis]